MFYRRVRVNMLATVTHLGDTPHLEQMVGVIKAMTDAYTEGTVDLVQNTMNVVTWVPFGALTDQAAGHLNTGLGSLLGHVTPQLIKAASLVPVRTKGPMDKPSTSIDFELFAKHFTEKLNPLDLIKEGIGELKK